MACCTELDSATAVPVSSCATAGYRLAATSMAQLDAVLTTLWSWPPCARAQAQAVEVP